MKKCPSCIVGNLIQTGAHVDCDKCEYSAFVMTEYYIDSCAVVIGELVSNIKFNDNNALRRIVLAHTRRHLPMFDAYLDSLESGETQFMASFMMKVKDNAINLQIGPEMLNEEQAVQALKCSCGAADFSIISPFKLKCKCGATFKYSEVMGRYMPDFICYKCENFSFNDIDKILFECADCKVAYRRTKYGAELV